jgi:hypothetical protein
LLFHRCAFAAPSLRHRCALATPLIRPCYALATPLLRKFLGLAARDASLLSFEWVLSETLLRTLFECLTSLALSAARFTRYLVTRSARYFRDSLWPHPLSLCSLSRDNSFCINCFSLSDLDKRSFSVPNKGFSVSSDCQGRPIRVLRLTTTFLSLGTIRLPMLTIFDLWTLQRVFGLEQENCWTSRLLTRWSNSRFHLLR